MVNMYVLKGGNGFMPRGLSWSKKQIYSYEFKFTPSCIYNFDDEDKYDWNKLMGISYNFFHNRGNVCMVGWRYLNEKFELAPYLYVNGQRQTYDPIAFVDVDTWFRVIIKKDYSNEILIEVIPHLYNSEPVVFAHQFPINTLNHTREIHPWFGGTKSAPHNMCILRKKLL